MLDFMRRHAQSWMIKAALGAVVVVFIFWGIWSPREGRERDLVRIGDQIITVAEARKHYQNLRESYQSIYGEKFTEEMAKKLGLKERAVKDLINKILLLQEAQRLGLTVSSEEVQASIQNYPAFQKDGVFDKDTYLRALQRARLTAKEFEANQMQMLLISKIQGLILSSAKVSEKEASDSYRATFEKVNLDAISLLPADIKDVSLTPEEVRGYFSKHREQFKIPVRVKAKYLLFDPKDYSKQVQITSKEVEDYYQNNREKFSQPQRAKIRHILIKADAKETEASARARKKAESIREEALKGKDFAQLAKQYSEDTGTQKQGGELGYISRGQVIPEIEEAIFSLKVGGISHVIQTPYGFHILKVDEIQEARVEPLEKVRDQIQSLLRTRQARELAHDEADQAYAVASKGKPLDIFAREKNLAIKETSLFSLSEKIELDPKLKDAALSLSKGEVSPVLRVGETFAVLQVLERHESRTPELKEVEGKVSEALRQEKQKEKALAKAREILERLKKGGDFKSLASREGFKVEETGFFERGAEPPKIGSSEELQKALSSLSLKNPYPESPIFLNGKYFILRLKEIKGIDQARFNSQKENYRRALLQQKQEIVLENWLEGVLEQAKAKGKFKMMQEVSEVL
ncbi:MAG: SurA N-terminal domain-containing protein [Deltaproteobacteria bacterium]|nr:SurA N-terminal domain-containing protein [Deltaproteobacteria bacterium]